MFNKKSLYSLNKINPDAIISRDAYGTIEELTPEDFESEDEFRKWKALSDESYHEIETGDHVERNHKVFLQDISDEAAIVLPVDEELVMRGDRQQVIRFNHSQIVLIRSFLTARQFRRLWLHDALGWRQAQIAELENISQAAVSISIKAARKKIIKKFSTAEKNYL